MRDSFIYIFVLFFTIWCVSFSEASSWPTSNVCDVKAEVIELHKRWIADAEPDLGMYVQLSLKILETGEMIRKYQDDRRCNEAFTVGQEIRIGEYEKTLLGNVQTLSVGQTVQGAIVSFIKGGAIHPYYVFQAKKPDSPLIEVISVDSDI